MKQQRKEPETLDGPGPTQDTGKEEGPEGGLFTRNHPPELKGLRRSLLPGCLAYGLVALAVAAAAMYYLYYMP